MKSLLARFTLHKAIGVCLGEHEVSVSKVAFTPLGPVETASASEPYSPEELPGALRRLLEPLLGRKRRVPVAVGLPCSKLFFGTRLIPAGIEPTAEAMLQKALCSTTISIDDLTTDMLVSKANKSPVASIAACRKKYISGAVEALNQVGVRPVRSEPAPCALVRLAVAERRYPRRSKAALCVFLGDAQGLAAMVVGGRPLAWKTFPLIARAEGAAILSAARTLQTQGRNYGLDSSPDYAVIHGRPDLHERLQAEQLPTNLGIRVVWQERPAMDGAATAYGLAVGCKNQNAKTFDLSRLLKARASLWDIFPWWDLAYASLLVLWLAMTLFAHSMRLDESYMALRAQCSNHKCLSSADSKKLADITSDLEKKVEAVENYLASRILWAEYTRDVSIRLPTNAALNTFNGQWTLCTGRRGGGGRSKKSFVLTAMVPLTADGVTPREIDAFLESLRNDPQLLRNFGSVKLTDIKRSTSRDRKTTVATFTVVCSPGGKDTANVAAKSKKGKKEAK